MKRLHLDFDDQETQHNSDSSSLNLSTHPHDSSTLPIPGANAVLLPDEDFHPPPTGYTLGEVFPIASDKDFDMLQAFPGSMISMTRIIHFCQMAAVPFYLVDGFLKIISEEVGANWLNLNDYPSHACTMRDLP